MNEHTKEPWKIDGSEMSIYTRNEDYTFQPMVATTAMPDLNINDCRANARRIVACVNACTGQPTELLEATGIGLLGKSIDKIAVFHARSMNAEQQRDKLLVALKDVVEAWSAQFERQGHLAPEWAKRARAVIAEIEAAQ